MSFLDDLASAWQRNQDTFWLESWSFLSLTLRAIGLVLLIGIPVGLLLSRFRKVAGPVIAGLAVVQTVPSIVLLGLLMVFAGIGPTPALVAAVLYSLAPVVMNTYIGVTQVPPELREAGRGMGMTDAQVLWHVDLPLAFPVLLAGVRTAAVYASGMIVVGAIIGAGGLGAYIFNGVSRADNGLIWLGTVPVLLLTLGMFWGLGGVAALARKNSNVGLWVGGGLIILLAGYAGIDLVGQAMGPRRADIVIGEKDFTEGQILAQVLKQMIEEHTDLSVEIRSRLGTNVILQAAKRGDIDLYPEYTGNLLTSKDALDMAVPADPSRITEIVRNGMREKHGLVLLETFGLNNTYAPTVTKETAERHRLKKISDLKRTPQLRVVIDLSFISRPDGWPGLIEKYGLKFKEPPKQVSPDLLYKALEQGDADVVIGFATDWQIQKMDLVVLEDDLGYFPNYHGAPLIAEATLKRHPKVAEVLNRLGGKIDDDTMRRLNYEVTVGRRSEADVAAEFLRKNGLLKKR